MKYYPDKWCIVKINKDLYKVFASFYGGYAGADSWKLNSGITKVVETDTNIEFYGCSGSVYICDKLSYGAHIFGEGVLNNLIRYAKESNTTIEIMSGDTKWTTLNR